MKQKRYFGLVVLLGELLWMSMAGSGLAQVAAGRPGAFLRIGVGARAQGLGGAFTAIAQDASAGYWNPAGLGQINELQFIASYHKMSLDRLYNFASAAAPVGMRGTVSLSWVGLSITGIEGRSGNTAQPDFVFNNSENALYLSYAHRLFDGFYFGVSAKGIYQQMHQSSAFGAGFDVALLYRVTDAIRLGLMVQDVSTQIQWDSGTREVFPRAYRGGIAVNLESNLVFSVDVLKYPQENVQVVFGGEYLALRRLPVRLGYTSQGMVAGGGIRLPMKNLFLQVDYAYGNDLLDGNQSHKISVSLAFAGPQSGQRQSRPRQPDADSDTWSGLQFKSLEDESGTEEPAPVLKKAQMRPTVQVVARVLNVRKGPGVTFAKIARLRKGQRLQELARIDNWVKIQLPDGRIGWVHRKFVVRVRK
ncbi:MAG: PorV/PorQ family protein [candidate division KSB1 bacterium]|nr:PorV/PorQ family protein [candidate division KSB1 bacterium]MDQ7065147.1 PorV/PorQ family protein [candidate division KSB1 bacterium]